MVELGEVIDGDLMAWSEEVLGDDDVTAKLVVADELGEELATEEDAAAELDSNAKDDEVVAGIFEGTSDSIEDEAAEVTAKSRGDEDDVIATELNDELEAEGVVAVMLRLGQRVSALEVVVEINPAVEVVLVVALLLESILTRNVLGAATLVLVEVVFALSCDSIPGQADTRKGEQCLAGKRRRLTWCRIEDHGSTAIWR